MKNPIMNKLPYGSLRTIARKHGVTEQYVNTVLRNWHNGEHMMYTATQKAIISAYKRVVKKYAPKMDRGIVITKV